MISKFYLTDFISFLGGFFVYLCGLSINFNEVKFLIWGLVFKFGFRII